MVRRIFVVLFVLSRTAKPEYPCAVISTNGESVEELTAKFGGCREIAELQITNSAITDFRFLKNFQRLLTGGRVRLFNNAQTENQMYNLTWLVVDGEWELHSDLCVLLTKQLGETLINADDSLNCGLSTLRVKSEEETKPSSDSVVTSKTAISPNRLRSLAISMTVDEVNLSVFDQLEELGIAGELGDRSLLRIFGTVNAWDSLIFPNLKKINLPNYTHISPAPAVYIWANYRMCIPQGDRDRFMGLVGNATLVKIQTCMCSSEFPQVGCESHINTLVLDSSLKYSQAVKLYRNLKHIHWGSLVLNTKNFPDLAFLMRLEEITCAHPDDAAVKFDGRNRKLTSLNLPSLKKVTNCRIVLDDEYKFPPKLRISKAQRRIYKLLTPISAPRKLLTMSLRPFENVCVVPNKIWKSLMEIYNAMSDCTYIKGRVLLDGKLLNNNLLGFLEMVLKVDGFVWIKDWKEQSFVGLPNLRWIIIDPTKRRLAVRIDPKKANKVEYLYLMPELSVRNVSQTKLKRWRFMSETARKTLDHEHQIAFLQFYYMGDYARVSEEIRTACYHVKELSGSIAISEYLFWYSFPLCCGILVFTVAAVHLISFIRWLIAYFKHKN